ncbi:hypothetical protein OsJ_04725 [Oryza sativa Japonica Group]|uniref:F-box domain-containing protein n=1 Tax=Oryza sativa subsp. japonica TaxID=39947 RepID=B9EWE3_ORYSJ|nr:hypothetical protein OsJ_04725 [Oryza sativa Japonica Group]
MAPPVCFSDLPPEALDDIARRAGALNNVVCSAVCRPWRRALKTTRLGLLKQPNRPYSVNLELWCGSIELHPIRRCINGERTVRIANHDGAAPVTRIVGSSHGWLVTVDEDGGLSLLEAVTGRLYPLPPITSSGSKKVAKDLDQMGESMFQKAELVPGHRLGTFAVMLIHGGGFSDLPPEALDDIARRAGALNNVVCSAVCRPWRRALKTTRLRLLKRPSRPYSVRLDKWRNGTISLCLAVRLGCSSESTIYVPIAMVDGGDKLPTRIIGSSHGWLVTVDKECGLSLLEAFTGRVFPLPPITSSGSKKVAKELDQSMFYKATLAPGRRLGAFAVMLIHGGGFGLSFLRPDAKSWTAVRVPKRMQHKYTDIVFHRGAFYTASRDGEVAAWAPDASSSGLHAGRVSEPTQECTWAALVESVGGDDLLMVSSFVVEEGFAAHGQWYRLPRRRYAVSRYDGEREGTSSWLPVEDLGEAAILVGSSCSLCVSTRGFHDDLRNRLFFAWPSYESGKYYCFHPDEYRLPTATPGCTYLIVPHYGGSWFAPYVAPEFHWY